jgi:UDP-xylose/UDP-N-acetylglucosamine transporter B4
MILGIIILKKRYTLGEYLSIVMISAGICICTLASSKDIKKTHENDEPLDELVDFFWWTIGILMLTFALLLSAGMGIIQEKLYTAYGKYPGEALYYNVS